MDNEARGRAITARAQDLGIYKDRELERATERVGRKVPRSSIANAKAGTATEQIYARLEDALALLEEEMGQETREGASGQQQVEIEVRDIVGIGQVIYRGPVEDVPEFESMIERLIERQRRNPGQ